MSHVRSVLLSFTILLALVLLHTQPVQSQRPAPQADQPQAQPQPEGGAPDLEAILQSGTRSPEVAEAILALSMAEQHQLARESLAQFPPALPPLSRGQALSEAELDARLVANSAEIQAEIIRSRDDNRAVQHQHDPIEPSRSTRTVAAILRVGDSCTYSTLSAALNVAIAGDTIIMQAKTFTGSFNINKDLTIIGGYDAFCLFKGSNRTTLDGTGTNDTVLEVYSSGVNVTLEQLRITGGENDANYGGGIELDDGTLTLENVAVSNNDSTYGGGIHLDNGTLFLNNSFLSTNNATVNGGGIYCTDSVITMTDNSAIGTQGFFNGVPVFNNPNIADSDNNNVGSGGGAYLDNCTLNADATDGSVISVQVNEARSGGGIFATNSSRVNLKGSGAAVHSNSAETDGGGLYLTGGSDLLSDNAAVTFNSAGFFGGGIYASGDGTLVDFDRNTFTPCTNGKCAQLSDNSTPIGGGGGLFIWAGADLDLESVYVERNQSLGAGSAIMARDEGTTLNLDSVMLTDNTGGGATIRLYDASGTGRGARMTLNNSTVAGNEDSNSTSVFFADATTHLSAFGIIEWDNDGALVSGAGDVLINCSILSLSFDGTDNTVIDPQFVDADSGNYRIAYNSPARNKCNGAFATDIDLDSRLTAPRNLHVLVDEHNAQHADSRLANQVTRGVQVTTDQFDTLDSVELALENSVRALDYGNTLWLEATDAQIDQLKAQGLRLIEQPDFGRIQFDRFNFDPLHDSISANTRSALVDDSGRGLYLVQMRSAINDHLIEEVEQIGTPLLYYPNNTYLVWAEGRDVRAVTSEHVRWVGAFSAEFRIANALAQLPQQRNAMAASPPLDLRLLVADDGNLDAVRAAMAGKGVILSETPRHVPNEAMDMLSWEVLSSADNLDALSQIPQVIHIGVAAQPEIHDERSNQIIAGDPATTGYQNWLNNTGYDGTGVTVAVIDTGVEWNHPDLNVVSGTEYGGYAVAGEPGTDGGTNGGHGTHVAGTIAGTGASNVTDSAGYNYGQGIAPGAVIHAADAIDFAHTRPHTADFSINNQAYTGTGSWTYDASNSYWDTGSGYNNNESSRLLSPAINLAVFQQATVEPVKLIWRDIYDLADSGDCYSVQYSGNGGATWVSVFNDCGAADVSWSWHEATLPTTALTNNFRVRFRLTTNGSGTDLGIAVPIVRIRGSVTTAQSATDADANSDLSNNSWGSGGYTSYEAEASDLDDYGLDANRSNSTVRDPFLQLFAAGNDGGDCGTPATAPCLDTISGQGRAKNIIVVGNSGSYRATINPNSITGSSSRGPAMTGGQSSLILPHVVAPGTSIVSTKNLAGTTNSCTASPAGAANYSFCTGTSMATPHVAGAAALFTQFWRVRNGNVNNPDPALVKAALIATTDDLTGTDGYGGTLANRPNPHQGWGRINIDRLLNSPVPIIYYQNPQILSSTGQFFDRDITVANTNEPLRLTVAWSDAPGAPGADPALVNDLKLYVTDPNGDPWTGNNFGSDGWSQAHAEVNDVHNNVENVWIENPIAGTYSIRIFSPQMNGDAVYYNGDSTDQGFSLVCYNCMEEVSGNYDAGADEATAFIGVNGAACEHATVADAISAAGSNAILYMQPGIYTERLGKISQDLTIVASTYDCTTPNSNGRASEIDPAVIDLGGASTAFGGILDVDSTSTVTLQNMTLRNAASNYGGAVYVRSGSTLILDNTDILNNTASIYGGGLRVLGQAFLQNGSSVQGNATTVSGDGGGIAIGSTGYVSMTMGSVIGGDANTSSSDGGGVFVDGGRLEVDGGRIYDNTANSGNGGGIFGRNGARITLSNSAWLGRANEPNEATNGGGAYLTGSGTVLTGTRALINYNKSSLNGGGIALEASAQAILRNSNLYSNDAANSGGGIYGTGGANVKLTNVWGEFNTAGSNGGVVALESSSDFALEADASTCDSALLPANLYCNHMQNNSAEFGGVFYFDDSAAQIENVNIYFNRVDQFGSAIYAKNGADVELYNSLLSTNDSTVVEVSSAYFTSIHNTYVSNPDGPVLYAEDSSSVQFNNNIVWANGDRLFFSGNTNYSSQCNLTQGASLGGAGDFSADPKFMTTARGNYRLSSSSPALNVCATGLAVDLDGTARTAHSYDMGAFESSLVPTAILVQSSSAGAVGLSWAILVWGVLALLSVGVIFRKSGLPKSLGHNPQISSPDP